MAAHPADDVAVAVEEVSEDADSAYGGDELASYTSSLSYSATSYNWEHGRRYHSFREGTYNFPNDEGEQERYDMMHEVFLTAMEGKHFLAPLQESIGRILDIGTGTGTWAMQIGPPPHSHCVSETFAHLFWLEGDMFPAAQVIGNDLSPIQSQWVPPNVSFEVDDVESEWQYSQPFDFIHSRYMAGSIADWPRLMRQCYNNLRPGGWVEFQDFDLHNYSQDNSIPPDNKVKEWYDTLLEGCDRIGRTASPGPRLEMWARDAGFVNIQHKKFKLPLGPWPKDKTLKRVGALNLYQLLEGLEGLTLALFTRALGWSVEAIYAFLAGVRQDAMKKGVHMVHDFHVVYAQRPVSEGS